MKEKQFMQWFTKCGLILLFSFIALNILLKISLGNELQEKLYMASYYVADNPEQRIESPDDLIIEMDRDDLVRVKDVSQKGSNVYITYEPSKKASGEVMIQLYTKSDSIILDSAFIRVRNNGFLLNTNTGNFSHYRERQLCITVFFLAFVALLWVAYVKAKRELGYSYHGIFCLGLGIWATLISVLLVLSYLQNDMMRNLYNTLSNAPHIFAVLSFPVVFIFALLLSISNISLIRHERVRFQNILGIILSVVMILGFILLWVLSSFFSSGNELIVNIWASIVGTLYCMYAILECFLVGAVICGTKAARNNPSYDKDYIVILGCLIRKDGTLYPLIRGRVDRAIRFYEEQLAATGKKAIFVPSGGQGSNEIISEAEAMKRYLLEQGFEPEQIIIEDQSKNTRQNMEFSKKIIGEDAKVAFSTTNFHVFRSGIISRQAGFEAEGMGSPTKWYFWPNAYIREVIGMLSYKWKALVLLFLPITLFLIVIRFTF